MRRVDVQRLHEFEKQENKKKKAAQDFPGDPVYRYKSPEDLEKLLEGVPFSEMTLFSH